MPPRNPGTLRPESRAFTVVEALVAIAVIGVAGAVLAASFTANGALRSRAAAQSAAFGLARARMALLAARPCAATDTSGVTATDRAPDSWTAHRVGAGWNWLDSIRPVGLTAIQLDGSVPCLP